MGPSGHPGGFSSAALPFRASISRFLRLENSFGTAPVRVIACQFAFARGLLGGMMGRAAPSRPQRAIDNFLRLVSEPHSDGMPPVNLSSVKLSISIEVGIIGSGPVCAITRQFACARGLLGRAVPKILLYDASVFFISSDLSFSHLLVVLRATRLWKSTHATDLGGDYCCN